MQTYTIDTPNGYVEIVAPSELSARCEAIRQKDIFKFLMAPTGNWRDYSQRGNGNRAARRALRTQAAREHFEWASEPIYQPANMNFVRLINRGYGLQLGVIGGAK